MQNKMDFTLSAYKHLISTLQSQGYFFQIFEEYIQNPKEKVVILRHDVDRLPGNALVLAQLEYELGVKASYYFRAVPASFDKSIMTQIKDLGHEIGYHYEDLAIAKGDLEKAIEHFERQLERFRKIYPVKTICMHGSPLSRYDNRDLWKKYDYRDFGIIAEPYFDVDFNEVFYITDTGRKWNNAGASIRDKVESSFDIEIRSTQHFIELIQQSKLPDKLIINTHPQRWTNDYIPWLSELVKQNIKNVVKRIIVVKSGA